MQSKKKKQALAAVTMHLCVCVYTCMCVAPCASSPCVSQTQGPPHGVCIDSFVKGGGKVNVVGTHWNDNKGIWLCVCAVYGRGSHHILLCRDARCFMNKPTESQQIMHKCNRQRLVAILLRGGLREYLYLRRFYALQAKQGDLCVHFSLAKFDSFHKILFSPSRSLSSAVYRPQTKPNDQSAAACAAGLT